MKKAVVKCIKLLTGPIPAPVVTAKVRKTTYVWLTYDARMALRQWLKVSDVHVDRFEADPILLRGHIVDWETGEIYGASCEPRGSWINGESLWVRVDVADRVLEAYEARKQDGVSWECINAVRTLAIAAGRPDPKPAEEMK